MRARTLSLIIFGLCAIAFPVTAMVLDASSGPGLIVFSMDTVESQQALGVTKDVQDTMFTGSAYADAAKLWSTAAELCTSTPNCLRVQIEGELVHKSAVQKVSIHVFTTSDQSFSDSRFQDQKFSLSAMEDIAGRIHKP